MSEKDLSVRVDNELTGNQTLALDLGADVGAK